MLYDDLKRTIPRIRYRCYYNIEIEERVKCGSIVVNQIVEEMISSDKSDLEIWDQEKFVTGKAIKELLLTDDNHDKYFDNDYCLKPCAYDKIKQIIKEKSLKTQSSKVYCNYFFTNTSIGTDNVAKDLVI